MRFARMTSPAVHFAREVVEYGEQVLGEFIFGATQSLIENHDFPAVLLNEASKQVESKPTESVTVGNHNLELVSAQNASQYGLKPFAFEVESTPDVFDDFRLRINRLESLALSFKVVTLLIGTDSTIADDGSSLCNPQIGIHVE